MSHNSPPPLLKGVCQRSVMLTNKRSSADEVVASLSLAVNSTLGPGKSDCPMLYTRVGKECLSFFSPAKVSMKTHPFRWSVLNLNF